MIKGEKIILRPFKNSDLKYTYNIRINLEINNLLLGFPLPVSDNAEKAWMNHIIDNKDKEQAYLAICNIVDNTFLGYCSLRKIDYLNGNGEFGIVILPEYQHKGFALEATMLATKYYLNTLRLHKIYCYIRNDNKRAILMFEKAGFIFEGGLKEHVYRMGQYLEILIYSVFEGTKK